MICRMFSISIIILVLLGGCANSRALAAGQMQAMGEVTMNVQEFVHQVFIEGVPYAEAAQYGSDDVPTLMAMLNEPQIQCRCCRRSGRRSRC